MCVVVAVVVVSVVLGNIQIEKAVNHFPSSFTLSPNREPVQRLILRRLVTKRLLSKRPVSQQNFSSSLPTYSVLSSKSGYLRGKSLRERKDL